MKHITADQDSVGHKGIGKSALLRMAHLGDQSAGRATIYVRPADLLEYRQVTQTADFNVLVEQWQRGLLACIAAKVIEETTQASLEAAELKKISSRAKGFITGLATLLVKHADKRLEGTSKAFVRSFADTRLYTSTLTTSTGAGRPLRLTSRTFPQCSMRSETFPAQNKKFDSVSGCAVMCTSLCAHPTSRQTRSSGTSSGSSGLIMKFCLL